MLFAFMKSREYGTLRVIGSRSTGGKITSLSRAWLHPCPAIVLRILIIIGNLNGYNWKGQILKCNNKGPSDTLPSANNGSNQRPAYAGSVYDAQGSDRYSSYGNGPVDPQSYAYGSSRESCQTSRAVPNVCQAQPLSYRPAPSSYPRISYNSSNTSTSQIRYTPSTSTIAHTYPLSPVASGSQSSMFTNNNAESYSVSFSWSQVATKEKLA